MGDGAAVQRPFDRPCSKMWDSENMKRRSDEETEADI